MTRTKVADSAADALLKAMLVFARTVEQVLETRAVEAAGGPMSNSRVQALSLLAHDPEETATGVALFLGVSKPAVTQIIDAMERDGLVRRRPGKVDRREVRLDLTAKGRRAISAVRREQRRLTRNTVRRTSKAQTQRWVQTLHDLTGALARADKAFELFCLQCGAHADGSCVLVGGEVPCRFLQHARRAEQPPRR
jgi:DNA-binding MarR family transcriptional regulator